ncbi:MAG: endonuclease/exonuclease/phosphatase family protein [Candidatus Eisenbacteria bacterium]
MIRKVAFAGALVLLLVVAACSSRFQTRMGDLVRGDFRSLAPAQEETRERLFVASYNIRYGEKIEQAIEDLRRDPRLARADVLLLQEMDPAGVERIARALGLSFVYYPATIHPHHHRLFGNAILARGTIERPRFLRLPQQEALAGTNRIAVVAEVTTAAGRIRAVSVHSSTPALPLRERLRQAATVLDSLAALGGPIVIGGDFNTASRDDTLRVLRLFRGAGFRDALAGRGGTSRSRWLTLPGTVAQLDHLFYRGLVLDDAGVSRAATASDHFPVWSVFRNPAAEVRTPEEVRE